MRLSVLIVGLGVVAMSGCSSVDYPVYEVAIDGDNKWEPHADGGKGGGGGGDCHDGGSDGSGGSRVISCDDDNECTNDSLHGSVCAHNALDHSHTCADGKGRCDGNIPACCTELDPACCAGCNIVVGGVAECVETCPGGQVCDPISVTCH